MEKDLYPIFCLHWVLFINVAAQSDNVKVFRAERAWKFLPYIIIPINFFKPHELKDDGSCATPSRLCCIQQVEEVIRVMKILPVSVSGVISLLALTQEPTFVVSQAMKMDRHIGPNFAIPAGSVKMMSIMTLFISLTLYVLVLQRALTKFTKCEDGIPPLRRIGIGYFFSAMCMVVAGLVEQQRRALATSQASSNGVVAMSVFWLFPQEMLLGLCEMFGVVGLFC